MAEGRTAEGGSAQGTGTGTLSRLRDQNPGADRLVEEVESYIQTRLDIMLNQMGHRLGEAASRLGEAHVSPHGLVSAVGKGGKKLGERVPSGAALALTTTAAHAKDTLLEKAKDVAGKTHGTSHEKPGPGPAAGKGVTVIEDIDIGVPVREAYNQWTQFQEFGRFAKGVVSVEQEDDTTTQWQVKIAKASRHWQGTITEQVPDERIAWTSEGPKGTTKGVVTFHPLAENLTKVLLVMEYFPKGVVEKTGALLRAQGRRTRLDLKLFRAFVMTRGEATGGWRGEIRGGEVVREPEEAGAGGDEEPKTEGDEGDVEDEEEYEEEEEEDEDGGDEEPSYEDRAEEDEGEWEDGDEDENGDEDDWEDGKPGAEADERYAEDEDEEEPLDEERPRRG